jgi:hypothetical protein
VRAAWPGPQRPQRTVSPNEHWEVPVSNPAELAGYEDNANPGESDAEQSYVDLGWADDTADEQAYGSEGDEFGSAGSDDHIELDSDINAA